jgi:lipopolysaccharide transport system ATP-binding protein
LLKNGQLAATGTVSDTIAKYLEQNVQLNDISVADRKDRIGNGATVIDRITIKQDAINTMSPLSIVLGFKKKSNELKITEIGLSIWTKNDQKIISISTDFTGGVSDINEKKVQEVECVIHSLPLVEGEYQLNVFISSANGLEDYITGARIIKVEHSDYFGYGKTVDPQWGVIAVKHSWNLNFDI